MSEQQKSEKFQQENIQTFHVPPIKKGTDEELRALNEIAILQAKNLSDYKEWAKKEITYEDIVKNDRATGNKMKRMNDAYAISLYTNCLSGMANGLSMSSLLGTFMEFKMLKRINPTFDQDLSRAMLNLRDSWETTASDNKGPFRKYANKLDSDISKKAGDMMNEQIQQNLENGTIDEMAMSPRQLAVLKMNFMEQAYVDMRRLDVNSPNYDEELANINENYETACTHLQQIANNGGFDMTVVAAEERHLVGLKIADNPDYALMFNETSGIYGVTTELNFDEYGSKRGMWSDTFKTADGENYTMAINNNSAKDSVQGSFTIRQPINKTVRRQQDFEQKLDRYAEQMAAMTAYVSSDDCEWPKEIKERVLKEEALRRDAYIEQLMNLFLDDGVAKNKKQAKALVAERFGDKYDLQYEVMMEGIKDGDRTDTYNDFVSELNHVIDKECCRITNKPCSTPKEIEESMGEIIKRGHEKDTNTGAKPRSDFDVVQDVRINFMNDMKPHELSQLLYHVGNNMEQGFLDHGDYLRYNTQDEIIAAKQRNGRPLTSNDLQYITNNGVSQESDVSDADIDMGTAGKGNVNKIDLKKKPSRELPDVPDESNFAEPTDDYEK